jgi:hypothetical protein
VDRLVDADRGFHVHLENGFFIAKDDYEYNGVFAVIGIATAPRRNSSVHQIKALESC